MISQNSINTDHYKYKRFTSFDSMDLDIFVFNRENMTPLFFNSDDAILAKEHINRGLSVHHRDVYDRTPLFYSRDIKSHVLIKSGANVNACDKFGRTSLFYALKNDDFATIYTLLINGADIDIIADLLSDEQKERALQIKYDIIDEEP
ncbi:ankyrin repeat domain-containing protein [Erwinia amylovora]|uniref:ankyrin repeat domain-containing protein n=1 Tax=Erwinia amylovora TaxID=552 RepID=UPI00144473A4|nr:ankyrin repeat domain-containing protein [Erwinia amylovora]